MAEERRVQKPDGEAGEERQAQSREVEAPESGGIKDAPQTAVGGAFARTARLVGADAIARLHAARVLVFGLGGVGASAVDALARAGIGHFAVVDHDRVAESNLNRQLYALQSTIGLYKADVCRARILDINPAAEVTVRKDFYLPESPLKAALDFAAFDYVIDCIDTVTAKIDIILTAQAAGVPVISAMGAGNRLDPSRLKIADLFATDTDPLCRVMRRELRKRGVTALRVVCSTEPAMVPLPEARLEDETNEAPVPAQGAPGAGGRRKDVPGSSPFVPPAAGLLLAAEVVRDLIGR